MFNLNFTEARRRIVEVYGLRLFRRGMNFVVCDRQGRDRLVTDDLEDAVFEASRIAREGQRLVPMAA